VGQLLDRGLIEPVEGPVVAGLDPDEVVGEAPKRGGLGVGGELLQAGLLVRNPVQKG
jgi:hypothetical protein